MATRFYLNDCLPQQCTNGDIYERFYALVDVFKELRKTEGLDIDNFWTLADFHWQTSICQVPLKDIIMRNSNPMTRTFLQKLVGEGTPLSVQSNVLGSNQNVVSCLFHNRDAHNLLLAHNAGMIAASVLAEKELETDVLRLNLKDANGTDSVVDVENLHENNRPHIETILAQPLPPDSQPLERLKALFGNGKTVHASTAFYQDWKSFGIEMQKYIVTKFEDAKNAGVLFPAKHNPPLMKRDEKDATSNVHELRSIGSGIRIYLECDASTLYIALYNNKGNYTGKDQDADFRRAKKVIERMRKGMECAF